MADQENLETQGTGKVLLGVPIFHDRTETVNLTPLKYIAEP